jgi:hypothetical protein
MKKGLVIFSSIIIFSIVFSSCCFAVDAWPGGTGTTIATYSDASGAVWHETRQSLFVVQNTGTLRELDDSGNLKHSWAVAGDLEGITLAENDRYLYIGIENPDSIVEFDLQTGTLTGKSWDLTTWMTGPDNSGLEGLSYRDGYFYAGLQADGKIYVFDVNLNTSGDVSFVRTITPNASYTSDISGLEYNLNTGINYVIYDSYDALIELNSSDEIVKHYTLPGTAQEGFAMKTNCLERKADVYVTNDDTGIITKYINYPITCLDADSDGANYTTDCNDYDATISVNQNYYRDADVDGLGDANTTAQTCSLSAPEGYVTNSSDPADISANGRYLTVNGKNLDLFGVDVASVQHTDLNFFSDDWHEIIAVGLVGKRAYITVARVKGSDVAISKKRVLKKRYRTAQITTQISKNKFTTRFNGKKKYVWKIKSSGSFSKSL